VTTSKPSTLKKIGNALDSGDDKGVLIAITIALIIISGIVAGYYLLFHPAPEGYSEIYVLDANGQAIDYQETLIVNQPTSYNVTVVNHMGANTEFEVQVKVTNRTFSTFPVEVQPVDTFTTTLGDGQAASRQASITLNETGAFSIIFELYIRNGEQLTFTTNALVVHVEGVNPV
jgi:uncharacterized membrane protein